MRAGDGDDRIRVRGAGRNVIDAGPGNDVIQAYASRPATITCGPGFDVVELDKHDRTSGDCEKVVRH
ncbi:hypothetical protein [Conexibacter sp. W3-3-2]|uniref:hypothetical protein n=1 Tax=Conexibacter sp. W3-3-2 TaxID=2675227 RepID=UPI0035C88BA5